MRTKAQSGPPGPDPSDEWLRAADARCRAADIRPSRRAWFALKDYAGQRGTALTRHDPAVERIFDWFEKNAR